MSGLQIKKLWFWSVVFSYCTQQIISQSDCDIPWKADFMWQPAMTSSVAAPRISSKALPKVKSAPKKAHGYCLVPVWSNTLSEFWKNQYIWEVCSANGWDAPKTARPAGSTGQQKGLNSSQQCPTAHHKTNTSKAEWAGLRSFASSAIFTWPLAKWLSLLQASSQFFAGKMLPQSVGGRKCFPRFHQIQRHGFLCYRNKQTSRWQKCVDCNGSYLD